MITRRLLLIPAIVLFSLSSLLAQDTPTVEFFGGYSYLAQHNTVDKHGYNASVTFNLGDWIGLVADYSFHNNDEDEGLPGVPLDLDRSVQGILFGPQFKAFHGKRLELFGRGLFGWQRFSREVETTTIEGDHMSAEFDNDEFVFGGGVGADLYLNSTWSIRLIQGDFLFTGHDFIGTRLSTGIVIKF